MARRPLLCCRSYPSKRCIAVQQVIAGPQPTRPVCCTCSACLPRTSAFSALPSEIRQQTRAAILGRYGSQRFQSSLLQTCSSRQPARDGRCSLHRQPSRSCPSTSLTVAAILQCMTGPWGVPSQQPRCRTSPLASVVTRRPMWCRKHTPAAASRPTPAPQKNLPSVAAPCSSSTTQSLIQLSSLPPSRSIGAPIRAQATSRPDQAGAPHRK